jgi:hypothetical protein
MRPLLSELQVPKWQELAHRTGVHRPNCSTGRTGPVEKYVGGHQDMEIVCVVGTRSWVVCAKILR